MTGLWIYKVLCNEENFILEPILAPVVVSIFWNQALLVGRD